MPIFSRYGRMWARNVENLRHLRSMHGPRGGRLEGVYVLCDGSMPVYVGRGRISTRIRKHTRSSSKSEVWDHFSWYAISDKESEREIEALLLRMLPFYLRSMNKVRTDFVAATREKQKNNRPDPINRPSFAAKRRPRKR